LDGYDNGLPVYTGGAG